MKPSKPGPTRCSHTRLAQLRNRPAYGILAILRVFDNAHRLWQYGVSYTPSQNPIPLGNGSYALVFPTINGVITYKVINFPSLIALALAGAAASIAEITIDVGVAAVVEAEAF
jgi:hypothetical protein